MATSISDIPFGSTVESLQGLRSFLDTRREGELQTFEAQRVLDAYYDRGEFNDHEGWYTVCLENGTGERFWVQAPEQQVEVNPESSRDLEIGTLPPVPMVEFAHILELSPGDRFEREDGVESTFIAVGYLPSVDGEGNQIRALTVETPDGTTTTSPFSPDEQVRVENKSLYRNENLHSVRQVPEGARVRLQLAYEPVRHGNFPASRHLLEGTIREMKPADPDYRNMLVYMVNDEAEGWLKVPTSQGVTVFEAPPPPAPPAPWDALETSFVPDGPATAPLAATVPGTVVSGLTVYPLGAVTGLNENQARLLNNALIQDIKPLGVDVAGKTMMLLSVREQTQDESLVIAERDSILISEFDVPGRAKPNPVRLAPVTEWNRSMAHHTPVLAQGIDKDGDPASFYGTLSSVRPVDDGFVVTTDEGAGNGVSTLRVPVGGLHRFEGRVGEAMLPVLPAEHLRANHVIVNDDGATATIIANEDREVNRMIVVKVEGMAVNSVIEVPPGKLFTVQNDLAGMSPEQLEEEMAVSTDLYNVPVDWEEPFTELTGTADSYGPGLG